MGAAFLIMLREGIEAALIVSILLAYLRQLDRSEGARLVWLGAGAAVLVSVGAGAVIFSVAGEFEGRAEAAFEGFVTLFAVSVLTWMIFWMRRQGARIRSELHERVDSAIASGGAGLAALAFFVVLREGIESALFMFATFKATAQGTGGAAGQATGAVLGLTTALAIGYLIYRGGIKLNLRTFFRVTGALVLIVAAGLFAFSVHELQEAGFLPVLEQTAYDISGFLSDGDGLGAVLRALVGYQDAPTVLELLAWLLYLVVAGFLFFRPGVAPAPSARTDPARTASA